MSSLIRCTFQKDEFFFYWDCSFEIKHQTLKWELNPVQKTFMTSRINAFIHGCKAYDRFNDGLCAFVSRLLNARMLLFENNYQLCWVGKADLFLPS